MQVKRFTVAIGDHRIEHLNRRLQRVRWPGAIEGTDWDHGTDIHFSHRRGTGPDPFPPVITNGWPGSFIETARMLPVLTDPGLLAPGIRAPVRSLRAHHGEEQRFAPLIGGGVAAEAAHGRDADNRIPATSGLPDSMPQRGFVQSNIARSGDSQAIKLPVQTIS